MDNDILGYARKYVLIQISYIEKDLRSSIYDDKTVKVLKGNLSKWESELERIENLIK